MKKKIVSILCCLLFSATPNLKPILDGRVTPIYLETRYTFTNFEWAKGQVFFRRGFDLPIGGTAILDIVEPVEKGITFNNSTLSLQSDLELTPGSTLNGSGFIDCQSNRIFFNGSQNFNNKDTFILISDGSFVGAQTGIVFWPQQGAWVFTSGSKVFYFSNIALRAPNQDNFVTQNNAPNYFSWNDVTIFLEGGSFEVKSNTLAISNDIYLKGYRGTKFIVDKVFRFVFLGSLYVSPGMIFEVNTVQGLDKSGGIILDSAKLSYTFTGTSKRLFSPAFPGFPGRGKVIIKGPCELGAPFGSELLLQKNDELQIEAGGRLRLDPGIKLKVF